MSPWIVTFNFCSWLQKLIHHTPVTARVHFASLPIDSSGDLTFKIYPYYFKVGVVQGLCLKNTIMCSSLTKQIAQNYCENEMVDIKVPLKYSSAASHRNSSLERLFTNMRTFKASNAKERSALGGVSVCTE